MADLYRFVANANPVSSVAGVIAGYDGDGEPKLLELGGAAVELTKDEFETVSASGRYTVEKISASDAKKIAEETAEKAPARGENPGSISVETINTDPTTDPS